jgi:RNA polymerase sigma factor (sigma-70 family)
MRNDPLVIALVTRAAAGDQGAWDKIVDQYSPLVWSICLRYRLDRQEIDDIGQNVWLLLVEKIGSLREPAALPGWLATTTQRECLRVLRAERRQDHAVVVAEEQMPDPDAAMIEQEIVRAERDAALRAAFAELSPSCRELLSMLICDPPCAYAEISATLGMAVGSIGPMRARCLERLRRSPHVTAIADSAWDTEVSQTGGERGD